MKKIFTVALMLCLAGCSFLNTPKPIDTEPTTQVRFFKDREITATKTKVVVAVLLPFSGSSKSVTQSIVEAIQLAYNNNSNRNIIIRFYDTAANEKGAKAAANLAVDEGADIILGPLYAGNVKAVYDIASKKHIPVLSFSNNTRVLPGRHDLYLLGYAPEVEVERIVDYVMQSRNSQRFVAMVPNNFYGETVLAALKATLNARGAELVRYVIYPPNTVNFTPYVEKLINKEDLAKYKEAIAAYKANNPRSSSSRSIVKSEYYPVLDLDFDTLFIGDIASRLVLLGVHLPYVGINTNDINIIGTRLWGTGDLSKENIFNNALYPNFPPLQDTIFASKFNNIFKHQPSLISVVAYEAVQLISNLVNVNPLTGAIEYDFSEANLTSTNMLGVFGNYCLRPDGLVKRDMNVMAVTNNGPVVVDNTSNADFMMVPSFKDIPVMDNSSGFKDVENPADENPADENPSIENPVTGDSSNNPE